MDNRTFWSDPDNGEFEFDRATYFSQIEQMWDQINAFEREYPNYPINPELY